MSLYRDAYGRCGIVDGVMFWRAPDGKRIVGKLTDFEGTRRTWRPLSRLERVLWWFTGPLDLPRIEQLDLEYWLFPEKHRVVVTCATLEAYEAAEQVGDRIKDTLHRLRTGPRGAA